MNKKTFYISTIIIVIIVSIITSLIAISYLEEPLLDPSGTVDVLGGLDTPIVDVMIIDQAVEASITDAIMFDSVEAGQTYTTTTAEGENRFKRPFVIRNIGNSPASITIYQTYTGNGLFVNPNSKLQYWVENPTGGWTNMEPPTIAPVDDCATDGKDLGSGLACFIPAPLCDDSSDNCDVPIGSGNQIEILSNLLSQDNQDEALLGMKIIVDADEPAVTPGTRTTTITITGSATPNPIV